VTLAALAMLPKSIPVTASVPITASRIDLLIDLLIVFFPL